MNVAIWGGGEFGKYVFKQLKDKKNVNVIAWVDSNPDLQGKEIEGVLVISNQDAKKRMEFDIDVVLVAFIHSMELLREIGGEKAYRYGFIKERVLQTSLQLSDNLLEDKNIIWSNADYLDKPILPKLETNIVDYCNLNCKGCSHFSNLFKNGDKVPFEVFCRDLEQLSKKVFIGRFSLLGGEVLLEDNITDYIAFARKVLPHSDITLVSNGLLLPKQSDRFFKCCIENDISITISGYMPTLKMKDRIQDILRKWGITYDFWHDVTEFWKNIDLSGSADKSLAMKRCKQSSCHFFRYGKLYKCPFEALGNKLFRHYGLDVRIEGGINIYDESIDWKESVRGVCDETVDACRYCGVEEKIVWSVENSPRLEDWIV